MVRSGHIALAAFIVLAAPQSARADCFDLTKGEPGALTGTLDYVIFPGPPNFKDVQGGDTPEPNYVLRLPDPICIKGDDNADATKPFKSVQVIETDATANQLRDLLHKNVTVTLKWQMAAETGHHHEPLVAWVTTAQLADAPPADLKVELGTAAATVQTFYDALGKGQGEVASLMVVPENRRIPAFSPNAMSRFYGGLQQPVRVVDISQSAPNTFLVHYRYATGSSACDGKAVVITSTRGGANYIDSIRALNGC